MDLLDWRIMQSLGETNNITQSARYLILSQPTITKRLKNIAREFDCPLFIRHAKGISLTNEGLYIAKKASQVISDYNATKSYVQGMSNNEVRGTLSLAASAPFARSVLTEIIAAFHKQYPNITFDIQSNYNIVNYRRLYHNEVPLCFIRDEFNWPYSKILVSEEKTYVISATPFTANELQNMYFIRPRFHTQLAASTEL